MRLGLRAVGLERLLKTRGSRKKVCWRRGKVCVERLLKGYRDLERGRAAAGPLTRVVESVRGGRETQDVGTSLDSGEKRNDSCLGREFEEQETW